MSENQQSKASDPNNSQSQPREHEGGNFKRIQPRRSLTMDDAEEIMAQVREDVLNEGDSNCTLGIGEAPLHVSPFGRLSHTFTPKPRTHRRRMTFSCDESPVPNSQNTPSFQSILKSSIDHSKRKSESATTSRRPSMSRSSSHQLPLPRQERLSFGGTPFTSPVVGLENQPRFSAPRHPFTMHQGSLISPIASVQEEKTKRDLVLDEFQEDDTASNASGHSDISLDLGPEDDIPRPERSGSESRKPTYDELEETIEDLKDKLLHAAELGQHLLDKKDELEQEIETAVQESWHYKTENKGLWERIEELSDKITQLQNANLKLETKNSELAGWDDMAPKDLANLAVPNLRPTTPKIEKSQKKVKAAENELKAAQIQILDMKDTISILEEKLDETEIEKNALTRRLSTLESSTLISPRTRRYTTGHLVLSSPSNPSKGSSSDTPTSGPEAKTPRRSFSEKSPLIKLPTRRHSELVTNTSIIAFNVSKRRRSISSLNPEYQDPRPLQRGLSIESFSSSSPAASQNSSPVHADIAKMVPPVHRRGGGLPKESTIAARPIKRKGTMSISDKEFDVIVKNARIYEEREAAKQGNQNEPEGGDFCEEDEFSEDEEYVDPQMVDNLKMRIQMLDEEVAAMKTIISAQRAQIRQYREKEKGNYFVASFTSGDYSNLAKELANERVSDAATTERTSLAPVVEEEERLSYSSSSRAGSTQSSRGGSSNYSSRGHRRGTPNNSGTPTKSSLSSLTPDLEAELGPQQRDSTQGKLKSRPGNSPKKERQSRVINVVLHSKGSMRNLSGSSPDSVREVEIISEEEANPFQRQPRSPPPLLVNRQVVVQSGFDEVFHTAVKHVPAQDVGTYRSPQRVRSSPNVRSSEVLQENEARAVNRNIGMRSFASQSRIVNDDSMLSVKPDDLVLYGDVALAEQLQKEKKLAGQLKAEIKTLRAKLYNRKTTILALVGVSCAILGTAALLSFDHPGHYAILSDLPYSYTERILKFRSKSASFLPSPKSSDAQLTVSKRCCCPQKVERVNNGSSVRSIHSSEPSTVDLKGSTASSLTCSPECLPWHCHVTKGVLRVLNVPFFLSSVVSQVFSFLKRENV